MIDAEVTAPPGTCRGCRRGRADPRRAGADVHGRERLEGALESADPLQPTVRLHRALREHADPRVPPDAQGRPRARTRGDGATGTRRSTSRRSKRFAPAAPRRRAQTRPTPICSSGPTSAAASSSRVRLLPEHVPLGALAATQASAEVCDACSAAPLRPGDAAQPRPARDRDDARRRHRLGGRAAMLAAPLQQLTVREYRVPAGGRVHPHDVAPARDGTVWYTGQHTGELGRLDPRDGPDPPRSPRLGLGTARRDRRA